MQTSVQLFFLLWKYYLYDVQWLREIYSVLPISWLVWEKWRVPIYFLFSCSQLYSMQYLSVKLSIYYLTLCLNGKWLTHVCQRSIIYYKWSILSINLFILFCCLMPSSLFYEAFCCLIHYWSTMLSQRKWSWYLTDTLCSDTILFCWLFCVDILQSFTKVSR